MLPLILTLHLHFLLLLQIKFIDLLNNLILKDETIVKLRTELIEKVMNKQ